MKIFRFIIFIAISFLISNNSFAQGEILDDFSLKALPDWIWGGVEMKYSHEQDNKENGYAEIFSKEEVKSDGYIGKIFLKRNHVFVQGNYVNVMLLGVKNDVNVYLQLIYDLDNNSMFDKDNDLFLKSKPISMNFEGWKEVKIKLDQENFEIVSRSNDNFEVTEGAALGIQLEFESGKNYNPSKFESGIALISEIPNKEAFENGDYDSYSNTESYFNAKNYPNPFNPTTTITYTLQQSTYVSLTVYDRLGRQVISLVEQNQDAGEHTVDFNASEYPSGIYFYRIKTPEKTEVKKMLFTK